MKEVSYIILLILFIGYSNGQVVIPCNFNQTPARGYECRLPDVDLSQFESFIIGGDTHLPGMTDAMVESFFSIHNNFATFPTTHIARFPNLRHIKVSESSIRELPTGAVVNRPLLQTLVLSANLISAINPGAFTNTNNILSLNLQFNQFRTLDNNVFAALPNLQELDVSFNIVERIPANMFSNTRQLITINMNSNRLYFLNQTFFNNLPILRTLFFQNNLCHSNTFLGLDVPVNRNNMFTQLAPCFVQGPSQFTCVFGFTFDGILFDDYTCLLRGIEAYDYTREINLGGFHLQGRGNADVTQVWIHLSDTRFVINQMFTTFTNLRNVRIETSNLQALQDNAFRNAFNLQSLVIEGNNLRRLEANSFLYATNLRQIHMVTNGLEFVHENAFLGLWNLQELILFGGNLVRFEQNTFSPLPNLRFLEVSSNLIETLYSSWFANNTLLSRVNFNNNLINAVSPNIVEQPGLTNLQLLENVCVNDVFTINDQTRDQVRQSLDLCFTNYPARTRRFWLELEGDLSLYWSNGTLVGHL